MRSPLLALALALAACGSTTTGQALDASTTDVTAADGSRDVANDLPAPQDVRDVPTGDAPEVSACAGSPTECVFGSADGQCGDAALQAACVSGAWVCPAGTVPISRCRCVGRPPGACACGPSGWVCDAGAPDVGAADAGAADASTLDDCDPTHVECNGIPPTCTGGGEVPSVRDRCWGPCVVFTRCAEIACDPDATPSRCPQNLVCYRTTRRCGPYL